jgi:hypothetical protein
MADINTDVIENFTINRYRWLANTPRAHINSLRCKESPA